MFCKAFYRKSLDCYKVSGKPPSWILKPLCRRIAKPIILQGPFPYLRKRVLGRIWSTLQTKTKLNRWVSLVHFSYLELKIIVKVVLSKFVYDWKPSTCLPYNFSSILSRRGWAYSCVTFPGDIKHQILPEDNRISWITAIGTSRNEMASIATPNGSPSRRSQVHVHIFITNFCMYYLSHGTTGLPPICKSGLNVWYIRLSKS